MSTKQRYGNDVWAAICAYDKEAIEEGRSYWFTAPQIARRGGVSAPTARKYLAVLIEQGYVAQVGGNRSTVYAKTGKN